jgi:putative DNA primase/helicase
MSTEDPIAASGAAVRDPSPSASSPVAATPDPSVQANQLERGPEREATRSPAESIVLDDPTRERLAARRERDRTAVTQNLDAKGADGPLSERFITALDQRLEKSELEELGWKGREDLNDVMRDLRKLAAVDFQRASELWSKYRHDDRDRPAFLDNDELSEDARRSSRSPTKDEEEKKQFVTPEQLKKRFLHTDNRYYFRHDDNQLAFEDHGHKLSTKHDDPIVALSMVQLAEAKGWQTINLKGTDEFKREAWLHASLKGMDVRGYKPRDVDIQKLAELQQELGPSTARAGPAAERAQRRADERATDAVAAASSTTSAVRPTEAGALDRTAVVDEERRTLSEPQRVVLDTLQTVMRQRGDSERAIAVAASMAAERYQNNRVYVGKVIAHGESPYENDAKNEKSYYLKLDTPKGEKVVWGVDLKRAIEESGVKAGDEVAIANQGKKQVTVQVKERDDKGNLVGVKPIVTNRNTWDVRDIETLRQEAKAQLTVLAERADRAPPIKVYDRSAERAEQRPEVQIEKARAQERSR